VASNQRAAVTLQHGTVWQLELVPVRLADGQVKQAIRPKHEPVHAPIVPGAEAGKNDRALVGTPIAVGIFQRDQLGWIGDVEFGVAPDQSHGKDQLVRKHVGGFVNAIAVAVLKLAHLALSRACTDFFVKVETGRFGGEQAATIIEAGEHWKSHVGFCGHEVDNEVSGRVEYGCLRKWQEATEREERE
jgi:hypothetical protein